MPQRIYGFTLIELLLVVAVFAILSAGIATFIGRSFEISREQFEQVRITDDARFQMERIGDAIRDAQFIDCDSDGQTTLRSEHWLQAADQNSIMIYTNFDNDAEMELVRYFTEPHVSSRSTIIHRGITQLNSDCSSNGEEEVRVLIRTLRNADQSPAVSLFRYFETGNDVTELDAPIALSKVRRVRLQLVVDESEVQFPAQANLSTDVSPRSVECDSLDGCGALSCLDAGPTYGQYDYDTNFAEDAFTDCMDHCATNGNLPAGECCDWSVALAWDPNAEINGGFTVGAACQCNGVYYPGTPTDFPNPGQDPGEYTLFARECFDGTRCGGDTGVPICDAGCLDAPGECYCLCES